MKLTLFKNRKGLIHGSDPKRIGCDKPGVLKVGKVEVTITPEEDSVMPMLFHGGTGDYDATFTTTEGDSYHIEKIAVRGGWISPPPHTEVELMELRCREDTNEDDIEDLREQIRVLEGIFDTNALNFLIK